MSLDNTANLQHNEAGIISGGFRPRASLQWTPWFDGRVILRLMQCVNYLFDVTCKYSVTLLKVGLTHMKWKQQQRNIYKENNYLSHCYSIEWDRL